jgi:hypothetical protein
MEFLFFTSPKRIEPLCRQAYLMPSVRRISEVFMLDILFIVIGLGFLAGAMLYAVACERM